MSSKTNSALKKQTSLSSAPPLKTLPPQPNISQLENFAMSALAPSMAVVFTLPFDTVKVRMQLQGEVKIMKDSTGRTIRIVAEKVKLLSYMTDLSQNAYLMLIFIHYNNNKGLQEQSRLPIENLQI